MTHRCGWNVCFGVRRAGSIAGWRLVSGTSRPFIAKPLIHFSNYTNCRYQKNRLRHPNTYKTTDFCRVLYLDLRSGIFLLTKISYHNPLCWFRIIISSLPFTAHQEPLRLLQKSSTILRLEYILSSLLTLIVLRPSTVSYVSLSLNSLSDSKLLSSIFLCSLLAFDSLAFYIAYNPVHGTLVFSLSFFCYILFYSEHRITYIF